MFSLGKFVISKPGSEDVSCHTTALGNLAAVARWEQEAEDDPPRLPPSPAMGFKLLALRDGTKPAPCQCIFHVEGIGIGGQMGHTHKAVRHWQGKFKH